MVQKGDVGTLLTVIEQMMQAADQLEQAEEAGDRAKVQAGKQAVLGLLQQLVGML